MKPTAGFFCSAPQRRWRAAARDRLLLAALSMLLGCPPLGAQAAPPATASLPAALDSALVVKDDAGREVHLNAPAHRIISLAPHATELIFEVGAGRDLVGVSEASDFPEAALALPQVGGYAGLDLERIVALKPDLVVAWSSGNSQSQIQALRNAGLVVFDSDPHDIEQIASSLERLGILTGHQKIGATRARALRDDIAALAAGQRNKPGVSVFYEVWDKPLYTLGRPHLVTQLMAVCGGRNLFSDINALAPQVSAEAVVTRKPDLIVTDPKQVEPLRAAWVERGLADAKQPDRVVGINADWLTRATSRIVLGTTALCSAIDRRRADTASTMPAVRH